MFIGIVVLLVFVIIPFAIGFLKPVPKREHDFKSLNASKKHSSSFIQAAMFMSMNE